MVPLHSYSEYILDITDATLHKSSKRIDISFRQNEIIAFSTILEIKNYSFKNNEGNKDMKR